MLQPGAGYGIANSTRGGNDSSALVLIIIVTQVQGPARAQTFLCGLIIEYVTFKVQASYATAFVLSIGQFH